MGRKKELAKCPADFEVSYYRIKKAFLVNHNVLFLSVYKPTRQQTMVPTSTTMLGLKGKNITCPICSPKKKGTQKGSQ